MMQRSSLLAISDYPLPQTTGALLLLTTRSAIFLRLTAPTHARRLLSVLSYYLTSPVSSDPSQGLLRLRRWL